MKLWQTRGEVQDSDDENDDLSSGFGSPRPQEWTQLTSSNDTNSICEDGRIASTSELQQHGKSPGEESASTRTTEPGILGPPLANTTSSTVSGSVLSYHDNTVTTDHELSIDNLGQPFDTRSGHTLSRLEPRETLPSKIQEGVVLKNGIASSAPNSYEVAQQILLDDDGDISDDSSVLSERDVSPPPGFQFLNPATQAIAINGLISRRNLRARKEIQLHPYLLDRAKYMKQCRLRGMRPVRFQDKSQGLEETQDQSLAEENDGQGSSSPLSTVPSNGIPAQDSLLSGPSFDIFDPLSDSSDAEVATTRPLKRRKIGPNAGHVGSPSHADNDVVPPSPSRTESGFGTQANSAASPKSSPRFRLPFGMAPIQLPTPQVSSDVKRPSVDGYSSSDSLPKRWSRVSTSKKPQHAAILIESSSDSSSPEQPVTDFQPLRNEQKRIKGVLPASWLRLDFRKQQRLKPASSFGLGRFDAESSAKDSLRKGVAQKIVAREPKQSPQNDFLTASEDESQDSETEPPAISSRLPRPRSRVASPAVTQNDLIDDTMMEHDWIDPMFGTSGPRSRRGKNRRSERAPNVRPWKNFSAERTAHRERPRASSKQPLKRKKAKYRQQVLRDSPLLLSIIDAPESPSREGSLQPQFVRVAIRNSRRQLDRGRHSPTHKHIHMATQHDTDDALSVLKAWQGRRIPVAPEASMQTEDGRANATMHLHSPSPRAPLSERSGNLRQPSIPSVLKNQGLGRAVSVTSLGTSTLERPHTLSAIARHVHSPRTALASSISSPREQQKQTYAAAQQTQFPKALRLRGAQIESLATEFNQRHRGAAFERRMQQLTKQLATSGPQAVGSDLRLSRFLHTTSDQPTHDRDGRQDVDSNKCGAQSTIPAGTQSRRRVRKVPAVRIDTEAREYRQPADSLPEVHADNLFAEPELLQSSPRPGSLVLYDFQPFERRQSADFDVRPLPSGTHFQDATFIGSGEFQDAMQFATRNLDIPAGRVSVRVGDQIFTWTSWNEEVATNFNEISQYISSALQSASRETITSRPPPDRHLDIDRDVEYILRSIIRYCSTSLWFKDPVDRSSCSTALYRLATDLTEVISEHTNASEKILESISRVRQYVLVIARLAMQLCNWTSVQTESRQRIRGLIEQTAEAIGRYTLASGLTILSRSYGSLRRALAPEIKNSADELPLANIVLLHHTLDQCKPDVSFWKIVNRFLCRDTSKVCNVTVMERLWYTVYTILPTLEINMSGVITPGSQHDKGIENWSLPSRLIAQVLDVYDETRSLHGPIVNHYLHVLLCRCYSLINKWYWLQCEQMLVTVYDFFARRGLALLSGEESSRSPRFLEHLAEDPLLEAEENDCAFHIFLKILATGLRGMQSSQLYTERKIGGIAYRLIPNHGKTYQKDVSLRTSDLDALRNNFDLLITLYYASPSKHRPRVDLLRNLVDHNTSHREACRLSIQAWTNIASYQASLLEPIAVLDPFIDWFHDIIGSAMAQYRLARSEAEKDVELAKEQGDLDISKSEMEQTVARNQRQIAATLVDALAGLKRVINRCKDIHHVNRLCAGTSFHAILEFFDPSQRRLSGVVSEVISVANTALDLEQQLHSDIESQPASEDSQDFGDSSALQELVAGESHDVSIAQTLHDPWSQFVSNVLGADETANDGLTQSLIDVWVRLIRINVSSGINSWISYINSYSPHSWNRLRDTVQKRKFTPYFMARIVEHAGRDEEVQHEVITTWTLSLVEREALLKNQHLLTASLMNQMSNDPLLHNLPFVKNSTDGLYHITLDIFRQRRLGLISSILANMRQSCELAIFNRSSNAQGTRVAYAGILKHLMQTMKANYQDLQTNHTSNIADENVSGDYVEFVQHVVSFLQQHTTEICAIDRFFTDSTAFPLPATDPTYVIGRLRSYVPRLYDSKTRKQLAVFIQTVSERAATDSQQAYLVTQLAAAMTGDDEHGDENAPSLRHVLMTSIFPAYFDNVIAKEFDWILALPMLLASHQVLQDLICSVDIQTCKSVHGAVEIMQAMIHCVNRQWATALTTTTEPRTIRVYKVLSSMLDLGRACLTLASYIHRSTGAGTEIIGGLRQLRSNCAVLEQQQFYPGQDEHIANLGDDQPFCRWPDTNAFASDQVRNALDNTWSVIDGHYVVRRGNTLKEVVVESGDFAVEHSRLIDALATFIRAYDTVFTPKGMGSRIRPRGQRLADPIV